MWKVMFDGHTGSKEALVCRCGSSFDCNAYGYMDSNSAHIFSSVKKRVISFRIIEGAEKRRH